MGPAVPAGGRGADALSCGLATVPEGIVLGQGRPAGPAARVAGPHQEDLSRRRGPDLSDGHEHGRIWLMAAGGGSSGNVRRDGTGLWRRHSRGRRQAHQAADLGLAWHGRPRGAIRAVRGDGGGHQGRRRHQGPLHQPRIHRALFLAGGLFVERSLCLARPAKGLAEQVSGRAPGGGPSHFAGFAFQISSMSGDPWARTPLSLRISSVAARSSLRENTGDSLPRCSNSKTTYSSFRSRSTVTRWARFLMGVPLTEASTLAEGLP